jgi:uncharacterized repeat protein (TIGR04042 family)
MPEIHVIVRWPDGTQEACYSPSLVMKDFFVPGEAYPIDDFTSRARQALTIASERVREKYGFACSRAAATLATIERRAAGFAARPSNVTVLEFQE